MASKYEPGTELQKVIAEILGSAASAKRVEALESLIETEIEESLSGQEVQSVGVKGARVPIDRVEAYGLRIGLDSYGNAATVESGYGLEIVG